MTRKVRLSNADDSKGRDVQSTHSPQGATGPRAQFSQMALGELSSALLAAKGGGKRRRRRRQKAGAGAAAAAEGGGGGGKTRGRRHMARSPNQSGNPDKLFT